jgi:prepilin-type N-terminal cleavage/methylation domain-containing protein
MRGFSLIEILVAISIIAALAASTMLLIPVGQEMSRRTQCSRNLGDLGALLQLEKLERPGRGPHEGTARLLALRVETGRVRFGDEEKLLCPGDPHVIFPRTDLDRERWDDIDLANVPDGLCSYAVRDRARHPAGPGSRGPRKQVVAMDRQGDDGRTPHHDGGVNVLYDDGAVKFLRRAELGLDPEAPIIVGRASDHPVLSTVSVRPGDALPVRCGCSA